MAEYSDLIKSAEMALATRDPARFEALMNAAEEAGMRRVDALVLRLGALSSFDAPEDRRRSVIAEYVNLAKRAIDDGDSQHTPLFAAMRIGHACHGNDSLLACFGNDLLALLDRIPDDLPVAWDDDGTAVAWTDTYKNEMRTAIAEAQRAAGSRHP
jgi:hypothetical protein